MKYLITLFLAFVLFTPAAFAADWTQINESGFGNDNNIRSLLFSRQGELFSFADGYDGLKAFQYDQNGNTDWTEITTWPMLADQNNGFPRVEIRPSNKTKFFYFPNSETGAEIWRLKKKGDWDQINKDGFGNEQFDSLHSWTYYKGAAMNNRPSIVGTAYNDEGDLLLVGHKLSKGPGKWKIISTIPEGVAHKFVAITAYKKKLYIAADGNIYKSKHGKKWHLKHEQTKVKRSGGFAINAKRSRLYAYSRSKYSHCGKYRNELWASPNGSDWNSLDSRPERKFCYSDMTFKKNGRTLVSGFTTYDADGEGSAAKMVVYSRKKKNWKLLTKNGFGNENNQSQSSTTAWKGKLVISTFNQDDGTEVFMKNIPAAK